VDSDICIFSEFSIQLFFKFSAGVNIFCVSSFELCYTPQLKLIKLKD